MPMPMLMQDDANTNDNGQSMIVQGSLVDKPNEKTYRVLMLHTVHTRKGYNAYRAYIRKASALNSITGFCNGVSDSCCKCVSMWCCKGVSDWCCKDVSK